MQCGLAARFLAFCSLSPVVNHIAPIAQIASNGVTCGRPSRRTVHSWYFWIRRSAHSVATHGVGSAPGEENGPRLVCGRVESSTFSAGIVVFLRLSRMAARVA